jgi:hypothetical protein
MLLLAIQVERSREVITMVPELRPDVDDRKPCK